MQEIDELKRENALLKEKIKDYEKLIDELSAPIIPSIIPNTILVPLMGKLTTQRFNSIQNIILFNIQDQNAETVLIDFTGISVDEVDTIGISELSNGLFQIKTSLELMGVETIFVGFSPQFSQGLVQAGVDAKKLNTHATFRTGLRYLMNKKGLEFKSK